MIRRAMPFIWFAVLIGSMLYGARSHAGLPACQYDDPSGSGEWELRSYKEPGTLALPDGGCVLWYCDAGHKWKAEGFCFSAADMAQYSSDTVRSWIGMTKDERNLLWANNVHPAAPGSIDERMIAWRDTLPKPDKAPPSGWVTQTTDVYKQSPLVNGYKMTKLSAEPLPTGAACNASVVLTDDKGVVYHALVDPTPVVMKKASNYLPPRPATVYARCVP